MSQLPLFDQGQSSATPSTMNTASAVKLAAYLKLVEDRKACKACAGLTNPASCSGGKYDCEHVGPWSRWQGNLNAPVMVVGQDWADVKCFERQQGKSRSANPTNTALMALLRSIGIAIRGPEDDDGYAGEVFLTNAILCLKQNGLQAEVQHEWFQNCGSRFLKPLIELIKPRAVVCLGQRAYRAVEQLYGVPRRAFRDAVMSSAVLSEESRTRLYAVYHCGKRIQNTHRSLQQQMEDWRRIGTDLQGGG